MACLEAPSRYLNYYKLNINDVISFQGNINLNTKESNPHVVFEIDTFEIAATSRRKNELIYWGHHWSR